jgi:hypothetical protein
MVRWWFQACDSKRPWLGLISMHFQTRHRKWVSR